MARGPVVKIGIKPSYIVGIRQAFRAGWKLEQLHRETGIKRDCLSRILRQTMWPDTRWMSRDDAKLAQWYTALVASNLTYDDYVRVREEQAHGVGNPAV